MSAIPDTWPLTYADIREIYRAGITRGNEEAVAFDLGSTPSGKWHDELCSALFDIAEAKGIGESGTNVWTAIEAWVIAAEAARK